MSSVDYLRQFVCERLTAAAHEIFGVFERTVAELQTEIHRQHKLLDVLVKPAERLDADSSSLPVIIKAEADNFRGPLEEDHFLPPHIKDSGESHPVGSQELRADMSPPQLEQGRQDCGVSLNVELLSSAEGRPVHAEGPVDQAPGSCNTPFSCRLCGKTFRVKRYLAQHLQSHEGETPFYCSLCGKSFRVKRYLAQHLKSHCKEKQYECGVCGKMFSSRQNLKVHTSLHTGDRRYTCSVCGKSFSYPSLLKYHSMRHKREENLGVQSQRGAEGCQASEVGQSALSDCRDLLASQSCCTP
ncbi:zinc finger and SCAN domain-containing protein 31-like [Synchiropus splendidus]|uniref:zinc finger and SCAN domain-containing protein 31-like n=1 Tax=Synchiropus splendidus TaxID=270530 RepID=UPI00237E7BBD|nr:zinc finger and SCAN domain-containing protein 31-like [Synchiropus splendidus]